VAITHWVLGPDPIYVFITAGSSVVGHNWMIWLKFAGGKGMGVTIGALIVLMPVYNYLLGLAIVLGLIIVPLVLIRNVALAMGIGLGSLPFVVWLTGQDVVGMFVIWSVVFGLIIAAKFTPTALASLKRTTSVKGFIRGD
jgi:glycerol-3-phosphate acyltransferase PlsY